MTDTSRPLVIVDRFPLPAVTGGRQRMWNFLLAIDELGPADLIVLEAATAANKMLIADALPAWSVQFLPVRKRRTSKTRRVFEVLRNREPSALARLDLEAATTTIRASIDQRRAIIAVQPLAAAVAIRVRPVGCRVLVDLWDIEDARLERLIAAKAAQPKRITLRPVWDRLRDSSDVRAWRRFNEALVKVADMVTVCSDIDRAAMAPSNRVRVVPNGADLRQRVERDVHAPPVILYHGQLTYPPNADAARVLVTEVLPIVSQLRPDVIVRIVGRADERVLALDDRPTVTVTGFVEDIELELSAADVLIVPLRVGGGTRLKILEAFSAQLPVVSTAIGAEGLAATNGIHLLIADTPSDIAAAAVTLMDDGAARRRMTDAALDLIEQTYDWRIIRRELCELLRSLIDR